MTNIQKKTTGYAKISLGKEVLLAYSDIRRATKADFD